VAAVTTSEIAGSVDRLGTGRVLVVGDLMVDQYFDGEVSRISPEAPVPVVDVSSVDAQLGGAANVARNVRVLGGSVRLVGLAGEDRIGTQLIDLLREADIGSEGVVLAGSRPTTLKTRVRARGQQIVRLDREVRHVPDVALRSKIREAALQALEDCDCLVFEDYDKGLLSPDIIEPLIRAAREQGKPVTVDPKYRDFLSYHGVTVFKPNEQEAEKILGMEIEGDEDVELALRRLRERLHCHAVLLTRGHRGMVLLDGEDGGPLRIATSAHEVFDVSGAGDTVVAALSLGMASGVPLRTATVLASIAAGIEVGKVGVAPVALDEIRTWLAAHQDRTWAGS
jgi:D-beta-D-heptose 7-phosphate kinase/D-beta-D-heptose 1-phosphate adenosyltransferase